MAENSKIEWCDHTFNPWMGCTRVSPGCQHCYAETMMDQRYGKVKWGPQGKRVRTAKTNWKQPLKWNDALWVECEVCHLRQVFDEHGRCPKCQHPMVATMRKTRGRVFCASLADVFEYKDDQHEEMEQWRADLFQLIEQTPNLDWLLLTKRPASVRLMVPISWLGGFPENVWIGTSVENQKTANERIPELLKIPAQIKFLSVEPMLGKIDLGLAHPCGYYCDEAVGHVDHAFWSPGIDPAIKWVICGGESGPDARPMNPDWVRSLKQQCLEARVPFFFKQWGEWIPRSHMWYAGLREDMTFKKKPVQMGDEIMVPVGKHRSGNFLDGSEWHQFPILNRVKISEE